MTKRKKPQRNRIIYRQNLSIGSNAAEDDEHFLSNCFFESGYTRILLDPENPKSIILGRTGSGKSALIARIENESEYNVRIEPETFSLRHIANSNVLQFFEEIGVKLDLFYQLLWKHVFCIELIKIRYKVKDESTWRNAFSNLSEAVRFDNTRKEALSYLKDWGDKFWLETEIRVKDITTKFETDLKASIGVEISDAQLGVGASKRFSNEKREEICNRAQRVVDQVQMQKLHDVINLLAEKAFSDPQKAYFILLDDLDLDWAESTIRYKLIRALVESIKRLRKIQRAKIIIALRTDLLQKVFSVTHDDGFQTEKYEDFMLRIRWNKEQLKELLDSRVNLLFKEQYTKHNVHFENVFPERVRQTPTFTYMIERTHMRPRDAISFINECLGISFGQTEISARLIQDAEKIYSSKRLSSTYQEWISNYPLLDEYCSILKGKKSTFKLKDLDLSSVNNLILEIAASEKRRDDPLSELAKKFCESGKELLLNQTLPFLQQLLAIMHKVAIIGIKTDSQGPVVWSDDTLGAVVPASITLDTRINVHPMLWQSLAIRPVV